MSKNSKHLTELAFVSKKEYVVYKTHERFVISLDILFSRESGLLNDNFQRIYFIESLPDELKEIYKASYENNTLGFVKYIIKLLKAKSTNIQLNITQDISILLEYTNYIEPLFARIPQKNIRRFIAKAIKFGYLTKNGALKYLKTLSTKHELILDLTGYEQLFEKLYGKNNVNNYMRKLKVKIQKMVEDINV